MRVSEVCPVKDTGNSGGATDTRPATTLGDFGLREAGGKVVKISGSDGKEKLELVSNFEVQRIRTGTIKFLNNPGTPRHEVDIVSATSGSRSVELLGSAYSGPLYEKASCGELVVPKPGSFKSYVANKIERYGIQHRDPSVDRVLLVGAFLDDEGQLRTSDNVDFPQQRQECLYHRHVFAKSGDKGVFRRIADLQRNDTIRAILIWGLGSPLMGALGWSYPHCCAAADSGTGKSTINQELRKRLGWQSVAGPVEFGTMYRAKKALANSVMPIQVEEVGRLSRSALGRLTQTLNLSYNAETSTHGAHDKTFVLVSPALLWGQDFPVDDVALSAKMIRVNPNAEDRDRTALQRLRKSSNAWPMRSWIEFLCGWANARDVPLLASQKADWLRRQLGDCGIGETSNSGRTFWNYGVLLVAAEALNAFGVTVDVEEFVVELARRHLTEDMAERTTVARQVLRDLLLEIQRPAGRGNLVFDLRPEGLYFKPENALLTLRRRGHTYDIGSPRTLVQMLVREKLGEPSVRHRHGDTQSRFFFTPAAVLAEFDFEFDGDGKL